MNTIEQFRELGNTASFHYADDSGKEHQLGAEAERQALELFDNYPDQQDEMREVANGFLWSLSMARAK